MAPQIELRAGMSLYDVDAKSVGLLVKRLSTYEANAYGGYFDSFNTLPPELWRMENSDHKVYVWDSVWSKDGRVIYSEQGLINLIDAGIIVILDDGVENTDIQDI